MIEYRTATGGVESDENGFRGLVTPFNVWTTIGDPARGGFKERVAPGTFAKTLQERDIVFLWNHNTDMPLARSSVPEGEGSLTLREDTSAGLTADCPQPVDTSYADDLMKLTRAKVVKGMSFGFEVIKDSWTDDEGRASNANVGTERTIHEVRLHEVSAVTFPAYDTTEFSARDAISAARENRAAKASYSDVETCGDCGTAGQYGSFCGSCGGSMAQPKSSPNDFCTSCGAEMDDSSRSSHVCETRAAAPEDSDGGQGVASIDAILDEALKLLDGCDRDSLPAPVNQAIDLLHGASKNVDAHMKDAGIPDPDESSNKSTYAEAADSTSDDKERHAANVTAMRNLLFKESI